jgi:DNA-binding beta-propeller fold protein YncE
VAVNSAGTTLYVAEGNGPGYTNAVVVFAGTSAVTTLTAYNSTAFGNPYGVAVNSGGTTFYVVDAVNNAVYAFNAATYAPVTSWSAYGATSLKAPEGVAVDGSGNVYVADTGNNLVEEFNGNGVTLANWNGADNGYSSFDEPSAVVVAGTTVYVADAANEVIRSYSPLGTSAGAPITTVAGSDVFGIAVDGSGNVYAADAAVGNSLVEEYSNAGALLTEWNGSSSPSAFVSPDGVALTAGGDAWVTDFQNGSGKGTLTEFGP